MAVPTTNRANTGARVCNILAIVFGAIAVLFLPIIFGIAGIILAIIGFSLGDRTLGRWAIPVAVVGTALGFFLGYLAVS
jgi:hypothetical protein